MPVKSAFPPPQFNKDVFLRYIQPSRMLSFGPGSQLLPLLPLNVLIGPNGSGKSNYIEFIYLLRELARHDFATIHERVFERSPYQEWYWNYDSTKPISLVIDLNASSLARACRLEIELKSSSSTFNLVSESILETDSDGRTVSEVYSADYSRRIRPAGGGSRQKGSVFERKDKGEVGKSGSILSEYRYLVHGDDNSYNIFKISVISQMLSEIKIYREWHFGRKTVFREPQDASIPSTPLAEDFSNLGMFLNRLRRHADAKSKILLHLRDIYDSIDDFDVSVENGKVQVFLMEGRNAIPATRLSDGTLRYLCLLAILCDPSPPPLICIEEPELGLHPDILPKIADLLVAASQQTQLIVTTHSDILVDAMTDNPEAIVVCEKRDGQTIARRLSQEELKDWIGKYRLGELWTRGEIGGTRW